MFRFNNPDALLLLLLVGAAYALTRALERGATGWIAIAGAAVGFAFLTKMMEAFLVVPAFAVVYLVAAPSPLRRRLLQLAVGGVALVAASGWWVAIVELVPASDRPYIGGSSDNSILNLIWGYNGVGRISGSTGGAGFSGSTGILRLFNAEMGTEISWLLPAALIALGAGLVVTRRRPRTDSLRASYLLWGGWLLCSGLVFSFMSGVIHPYYTNLLAPAIAVLIGLGVTQLWQARRTPAARVTLATMLGVTGAWAFVLLGRTPNWHPWLGDVVLIGSLTGALALVALASRPGVGVYALAFGALSLSLAAPVAYSLSTTVTAQSGPTPSAGPASSASVGAGGGRAGGGPSGRLGGPPTGSPGGRFTRPAGTAPPSAGASGFPGVGRGVSGRASLGGAAGTQALGGPRAGGTTTASPALIKLLESDGTAYTWVAATGSSMTAAPIELATGEAVMSIGGFNGSDQAISLARFKQLVAAGEIHYYVAGGGAGGGQGGPGGGRVSSDPSQIAAWVTAHFKAETVGGTTVYDLTSG
jgi:4-amino-4-deoxy-L-arabinose transferase-like glycosyltransferase